MQVDLYNGHKMVVVAVPEKPLGISDRLFTRLDVLSDTQPTVFKH